MNLNLSRRSLLLVSTSLMMMPFVPAVGQSLSSFTKPLALPPLLEGEKKGGVRIYDMTLQNGTTEFFEGRQTATKGINGSYLGPAMRLRSGETVRVNVANNLGHPSTLHWHGLNIPAIADGGPHQIIASSSVWSPEFVVQEVASTMWYHSHMMGETASQVWAGLAGVILIDDDISDALDVPSQYGIDDVPIILQDRRFARDGAMPYSVSMHDEMAGMTGDVPLVNGMVQPFFEVTTQKLRLRLLNGSNAGIYHLEFTDGRVFEQIATDGGFLTAPVAITSLRLAPGERAEIVLEFTAGETALLRSVSPNGRGMGMGGMMTGAQSPSFDFITFRAANSLSPSPELPSQLVDLPDVSAAQVTNTRKFLLEMPSMGPMRMLGLGGGYTINDKTMDMGRVDEVVKKGETEVWEISNSGPMAHPFHIHNTQFRILDRNGNRPAANEVGRKDTVVIDPGETVRLLVRFDHYADAERPYMYHCHILEHEDAGMMGQFTVV